MADSAGSTEPLSPQRSLVHPRVVKMRSSEEEITRCPHHVHCLLTPCCMCDRILLLSPSCPTFIALSGFLRLCFPWQQLYSKPPSRRRFADFTMSFLFLESHMSSLSVFTCPNQVVHNSPPYEPCFQTLCKSRISPLFVQSPCFGPRLPIRWDNCFTLIVQSLWRPGFHIDIDVLPSAVFLDDSHSDPT